MPALHHPCQRRNERAVIFSVTESRRDTGSTLNRMNQQKGTGLAHLLGKIRLTPCEKTIVTRSCFRSESDSCSTKSFCGPMHELCMRKHSISYCCPIVLDDNHLWMMIRIVDELFSPISVFSYRMCWFYYVFFTYGRLLVQTFMIDFYDSCFRVRRDGSNKRKIILLHFVCSAS